MAPATFHVTDAFVKSENKKMFEDLDRQFVALGKDLASRGQSIGAIAKKAKAFAVSIPSWGMATGGTRFGKFPVPGQPRNVFEKIDDAAAAHQLTRANPNVSLHVPWDAVEHYPALKKHAAGRGIKFDAINSNTFEDQPGQKHSYKFGSLSHSQKAVRQQAIAHNLAAVEVGTQVGARSLNVWIADGSNFPGQTSMRESFDRYLESLKAIYQAMPQDWDLWIEYKPFEPAFYYTVLADWGSALMAAQATGERCRVLVDLGHHLPGTNVEMIVARLIAAGKLGGFHFNDNKYADDDLTAGAIDPYRLFRVFHELVLAAGRTGAAKPAFMIDQSHNLKDPIEAVIQSTMELEAAYVKALLVDQTALKRYQTQNDVLMAERELKAAFDLDVRPITAMARKMAGGAIDPIAVYRASGYRQEKANERGG